MGFSFSGFKTDSKRSAKAAKDLRVLSVLGLAFLMLFQNCSEARLMVLKSVAPPVGVKANGVIRDDGRILFQKILFIVDQSGSNQTTDNDKAVRAGSMRLILNRYFTDTFFKWGFATFSEGAAARTFDPVTGREGFTDSGTVMSEVDVFVAEPHKSDTPYLAALDKAMAMIRNDLEGSTDEDSVYNVFFMSDGAPTDNVGAGNRQELIYAKVRDLVNIDTGRIFLNTIYYTPNPTEGTREILRAMAEDHGRGRFTNTTDGSVPDLDSLRGGLMEEAYKLRVMAVYNLNAGFCTDGSIDTDSDADGLCDKDEVAFNNVFRTVLDSRFGGRRFDPVKRHSIDPKYSDKFFYVYELIATSNGLPDCSVPQVEMADQDFDFLNYCEERALFAQPPVGMEEGWTQSLIEDFGGRGDWTNPDSDGDGYLDFIEFFQFQNENLSLIANTVESVDPRHSGVRGLSILRNHYHPLNPVSTSASYDPYFEQNVDYRTGFYSFKFRQDKLELYKTKAVSVNGAGGNASLVHEANKNLVLIYYIAYRTSNPTGKGVYFYKILNLDKDTDEGKEIDVKQHWFERYKPPVRSPNP
jgi:hypothetical protein